jgi:hypothetical protein
MFITSLVAYDVTTTVKALNAASERGAGISMLLMQWRRTWRPAY